MDAMKVGALIASLRTERGLTQQGVADALGVSNKTVSKWECGLGCPDAALLPEVAAMFGVETSQLMSGELTKNPRDNGNVSKVRFYVCPTCGNVLTSTGAASLFCCGQKLEPLPVAEEKLPLTVEWIDTSWFVTVEHPMEKENHLLFAAAVTGDRVFLQRLYPEQEAQFRIPGDMRGQLYLYCKCHGLTRYLDLMRAKRV